MSNWFSGFRGRSPRKAFLVPLLCLSTALAFAQTPAAPESQLQDAAAVLPSLLRGGYVIYMRHELTDVQDKSEGGDLNRCETQRNLSAAGRAEASAVGRAIQALGVPVGSVYSSPFCRCKDTASLVFGRYEVMADLHFALDASVDERRRLAAALRTMLATSPPPGLNTVIVAHTANLREAVGIWPKPEGVAYIFRPLGDQRFEPVARVMPGDWSALAAASKR